MSEDPGTTVSPNLRGLEGNASVSNKNLKLDGDEVSNDLIGSTLFRLTRGIPKRELALMVSEADECEKLLEQDIAILENALKKDGSAEDQDNASLNTILESAFTPLDRFWTASALLGRLRREMMLPSIHTDPGGDPRLFPPTEVAQANTKKNASSSHPNTSESQSAQELAGLKDLAAYTQEHRNSAHLLALWKKISSNRAALVFKRPVRPEEAPGYSDRIVFPMDLSLIRKLIVSGKINSFEQLHDKIGLISHNCVKYNGRETDYGRVARHFEAMADEYIRQAVYSALNAQQHQLQSQQGDTTVSQPTETKLGIRPAPSSSNLQPSYS